MARFPYQNSTFPLAFKIWHSYFSKSTFVFKFRHSSLKVDVCLFFSIEHFYFVFQVWRSVYSIEHSFFNSDFRFIPSSICFSTSAFVLFHSTFFFIRHLYFKFDIWVINSSSRFSTLTFVFQVQHSLFVQLKILNVDKTASKWLKNKRCSE